MDRKAKIEALKKDSFDKISDKDINRLYNKIIQKKENKVKNPTNIIIVDTTSAKYKIFLKFINKILVNIDKDEIDDLTQFKHINRVDIIKSENKIVLDKMAPKIFKHFNKQKCGYYRKTNFMVSNVIRGMCKELNVSFKPTKKDVYERINNKTYKRSGYFYTINLI